MTFRYSALPIFAIDDERGLKVRRDARYRGEGLGFEISDVASGRSWYLQAEAVVEKRVTETPAGPKRYEVLLGYKIPRGPAQPILSEIVQLKVEQGLGLSIKDLEEALAEGILVYATMGGQTFGSEPPLYVTWTT